jgi:hypothetical protein
MMLISIALYCSMNTSANAGIIELALVLDASGSIGSRDFALQIDAYADVFSNNFVTNFVNPNDTLYVSIWRFASSTLMVQGATLVDSDATAAGFSAIFKGISYSRGRTNTTAAVNDAANELLTNSIISDRMIIDISTDGQPNSNSGALAAASTAKASGVTVNAIGIGSGISTTFLDNFTTAGGGFYVTADNFSEFKTGLERKLEKEISTVPEPSTWAIFAIALTVLRLRKSK